MKRNITAIILVFAMLAGFASCKKLENDGEWVVESKVYVTDSYGAQHDVQSVTKTDGETEYYYYNTDGNKVTVAHKDVVVSTTRVFKTAPTTLTPEQQSFFEEYSDPEAFKENVIEETVTEPEFEISDEPIPEEEVEEITNIEVDNEGKPVRKDDEVTEILKGESYTVDYVLKADYNGKKESVPVYLTKDGEDVYMNVRIPFEDTGVVNTETIVINNECYLVVPAMKAYFKVTADQIGEAAVVPPEVLEEEIDSNYIKSGQIEIDGVTYEVDFYESEGQNIKRFYKNDELKRIEVDDGNGNVTILEIRSIKKGADKSKLRVPSGYLDLTSTMGENFDPNTLITP